MAEEQKVPKQETSELGDMNFRVMETEVEVRRQNHMFIFRIPSPRQIAAIGVRARQLRMMDFPGSDGSEEGLGWFEAMLYRAMATFESLLKTSSDTRLFSSDDKNNPVVDSSKWDQTISPEYIMEVYDGYLQAIDSFRQHGNGSK